MKKCPKCGSRLREGSAFCVNCGAKITKGRYVQNSQSPKRSKFFLIIGVLLMVVVVITCIVSFVVRESNGVLGSLKESHVAVVQDDLNVFSDGNISEITERVFGATSDAHFVSASDSGIIADLFTNAEVQIASTDDSNINYTILSPDISDFFIVCADQINTITTSEELGQAILEYAKTAPTKEYTVSVPYSVSGESISVAYDNPDFINAMTGGLLDAYMVLYEQYLAEG